jgi:3-methyladenine DNA glycosylase AlkD
MILQSGRSLSSRGKRLLGQDISTFGIQVDYAKYARLHSVEPLLDRDYLAHTSYINNWDLVDVSCGPIVGGYLQGRDRAPLYGLACSTLIWERRIAMISTQQFLRSGESKDLFGIAELLLSDRHDLIHKAVGWSLREAGKKVDQDQLRHFLDTHAARMPRTALRYAIEHFDESERQHYLRAKPDINTEHAESPET